MAGGRQELNWRPGVELDGGDERREWWIGGSRISNEKTFTSHHLSMSSTKFQWAFSNFISLRSLTTYPIFEDKPEDQKHAQQSITLKSSCKTPQPTKSSARIRSQPIEPITVVLLNLLKKTVE